MVTGGCMDIRNINVEFCDGTDNDKKLVMAIISLESSFRIESYTCIISGDGEYSLYDNDGLRCDNDLSKIIVEAIEELNKIVLFRQINR